MPFRHQGAFYLIEELVGGGLWGVREHGLKCVLAFEVPLGLVLIVTMLKVLLGFRVQVLELLLVELLKKGSGEQSHLIGSVFTHLVLLLLAIVLHELVGAALGYHHLALLNDLGVELTQLVDKIVVDLLLLLQLLKKFWLVGKVSF